MAMGSVQSLINLIIDILFVEKVPAKLCINSFTWRFGREKFAEMPDFR